MFTTLFDDIQYFISNVSFSAHKQLAKLKRILDSSNYKPAVYKQPFEHFYNSEQWIIVKEMLQI